MAVATGAQTVHGYDLQAEQTRYRFPDVELAGHRLNRGTASPRVNAEEPAHHEDARLAHRSAVLPTTVDADAPVLELGYPTAGMYVMDSRGVHLDAMLGVGQKLFDPNHPRLVRTAELMRAYGIDLRREISTDDFLVEASHLPLACSPQELAALFNRMALEAFPAGGPFKTFFSNSGTEAVEAGIKTATLVKYRRLVERYGIETFAEVCWQLGIERDRLLGDEDDPIWEDYPFFLFAAERAFHGRTLGSLSLTHSKPAQVRGFPKLRWVKHIPYNRDYHALERLIDPRPLPEILGAPGGVAAVVGAGMVPRDLAAGLVIEGFQGEGGYVPMVPEFAHVLRDTCDRFEMLLVADEVQSFLRTGRTFMFERLGVEPDVVCVAKVAVVGLTAVRADLERYLHHGWHANTWGGGKLSDNALSYATLDEFSHGRSDLFAGLSYAENLETKGHYLQEKLEGIRDRHPQTLCQFEGFGGMHGVTLRRRDEVIAEAWRRGLKLLGCGAPGDEARVRILLLADVLTKEIDDLAALLESAIEAVERDDRRNE